MTVVRLLQVPEGVQNSGVEVSELQLMAENQINMEATAEAAEDSSPQTGGAAVGHADVSAVHLERHVFVLSESGGSLNPSCVTNTGYYLPKRTWNPLGGSAGSRTRSKGSCLSGTGPTLGDLWVGGERFSPHRRPGASLKGPVGARRRA